jgi:hypothetical protein
MTLGSHQRSVGKSQEHFTPKWIIDALGPFGLDPCAGEDRPWDCAAVNICLPACGLAEPWPKDVSVWLNPPFDRYEVGSWLDKLAGHGNGIALLHARTEAEWFRPCWMHASALLFMDRRITFCRADGSAHPANSGAPPVLVAFGLKAYNRLLHSLIRGAFVRDWSMKEPS